MIYFQSTEEKITIHLEFYTSVAFLVKTQQKCFNWFFRKQVTGQPHSKNIQS